MPASALRRWWLRRTHGSGPWGALLQAAAAGEWVSLDLETTGMGRYACPNASSDWCGHAANSASNPSAIT